MKHTEYMSKHDGASINRLESYCKRIMPQNSDFEKKMLTLLTPCESRVPVPQYMYTTARQAVQSVDDMPHPEEFPDHI